jgi:SAM-dependent methyltransferase
MSAPLYTDAQFPERFVPEQMHGLIEVEHLARYRWACTCAAGRRVLDAGCGVGYGSLLLHAAGSVSVTGVDIAHEAVDEAVRRAGHVAQFVLGDVADLPLDDASFEMVVCFETIEHVLNQDRALDELRRVLVRDGLLFVSSPNREVYAKGNPYHTREYTPDELRVALRERFANVSLDCQQAWLASMICDDETLRESASEHFVDIKTGKVAPLSPGRETFTLAIASNGELPAPAALAMLTDLSELANWRERALLAEKHLTRSHEAAVERGFAYQAMHADYKKALAALERSQRESARRERSLNRISTLLAERNAALRLAASELAGLCARAAELETQLGDATSSLSSRRSLSSARIAAPFRALARRRHDA